MSLIRLLQEFLC